MMGRHQKILPNESYRVRRLNTNKTQTLHRICPKKFLPNQPLQVNFREERLQPDEEIVIRQDDSYIITWETNFGEQQATRGNELFRLACRMANGRLRRTLIQLMQMRMKMITK